jgi:hypothetical protein
MTKSNKVQAVAMAAMVAAMVMGFAASSEAQLNRKRSQYIASANGGAELARKRQVFVADASSLSRRRTVYVADASGLTVIRRSQWIMRGLLARGR